MADKCPSMARYGVGEETEGVVRNNFRGGG